MSVATQKKPAVLEAYKLTASVSAACKCAQIDRTTFYNWLRKDKNFAAAFDACKGEAAEALEDEAVRRAHEGVDEPVFYKGDVCGTVRKYSDTLLIFLLKGARPDKYRENINQTVTITGDLAVRLVAARRRAIVEDQP